MVFQAFDDVTVTPAVTFMHYLNCVAHTKKSSRLEKSSAIWTFRCAALACSWHCTFVLNGAKKRRVEKNGVPAPLHRLMHRHSHWREPVTGVQLQVAGRLLLVLLVSQQPLSQSTETKRHSAQTVRLCCIEEKLKRIAPFLRSAFRGYSFSTRSSTFSKCNGKTQTSVDVLRPVPSSFWYSPVVRGAPAVPLDVPALF